LVEATGYALTAMEQLFGAQLGRAQKELWLRRVRGIPVAAAQARAQTGDLRGAVTAMDSGRALLLREVLDRDQADLGRLVSVGYGDFADRYRSAAARWADVARRRDQEQLWSLEYDQLQSDTGIGLGRAVTDSVP
jgi:hypothetical protein